MRHDRGLHDTECATYFAQLEQMHGLALTCGLIADELRLVARLIAARLRLIASKLRLVASLIAVELRLVARLIAVRLRLVACLIAARLLLVARLIAARLLLVARLIAKNGAERCENGEDERQHEALNRQVVELVIGRPGGRFNGLGVNLADQEGDDAAAHNHDRQRRQRGWKLLPPLLGLPLLTVDMGDGVGGPYRPRA
ncbi:hypothetical protein T492DRAFT_1000705 [Pavlovales sp. CCMP2436]|nr:hypothetical protein T492DRAFT_1000705 [Pavlovales sp. CCMP2436]